MIPTASVDPAEFSAVQKRIDSIEEKVEFVNSEIKQTEGKRFGREVGILYGFLFGALIYIAYSIFVQLKLL